ncbi:pyridoxamine 5'-phosphate oxidase family protein [Kitasatospora sp. GAS204B]|uniref:pyridoxamine 5'-phosphate oxidase family protein n=1 Tax=unclassified Kitasatospora TaxID=2633591 RepID=UPI0024744009|nr:pyridoxamine 5'-phosphate oxidase family protein [Kitasatospora sp. GAS204B]MDH6120041.1 putative pyridoxine 5'-phosphate oxidase superfamily flavin-nucleotide-binding protein [Kitasatospora sp. GAS204B]
MSVYHRGERAVQSRVDVLAEADRIGRSVGRGISEMAGVFLGVQRMLVLGAADDEGRLWASPLTGPAGFARATGPYTAAVAARPVAGDPLAEALTARPAPVGVLALDPRIPRRLRVNGTARPTPRGLAIDTEQVFANCPRYLRRRRLLDGAPVLATGPGPVARTGALDAEQRQLIGRCDTFFIATAADSGSADASHRGGDPGFVQVLSSTRLAWPDYPGNAMFMTLGNLELDARAGLLFLDWTTGATLHLTGTAHAEFGAAGRTVHFELAEAVANPAGSPLRWSTPEPLDSGRRQPI